MSIAAATLSLAAKKIGDIGDGSVLGVIEKGLPRGGVAAAPLGSAQMRSLQT